MLNNFHVGSNDGEVKHCQKRAVSKIRCFIINLTSGVLLFKLINELYANYISKTAIITPTKNKLTYDVDLVQGCGFVLTISKPLQILFINLTSEALQFKLINELCTYYISKSAIITPTKKLRNTLTYDVDLI